MAEPSGYSYYKDIDIQDANIDGNLTNVPTLIQIVDDSDIGGHVVDDTTGHDIRFYDVTTDAILYYDRVYFDVTAGDCNATFYVKCPALYASVSDDQNNIRIYYGKAADSDGEDKANTWSDYVGVWHCADASGTIVDATGNHKSASETITAYQAAGKIRYAIEFDGTNDYVEVNDHADFTTNFWTISCWANFDTLTNSDRVLEWRDYTTNDGFQCIILNSKARFTEVYAEAENHSYSDDVWSTGSWMHIAWTGRDEATDITELYEDGVVQADTDAPSGEKDSSNNLYWGAKNTTPDNSLDGHMEELRYRTSGMTANHIKFEHANQNEVDFELTWGSETSTGGAAYTIECTTGTYAVTGKTLNALWGHKAICTTGTYAVTGKTLNALVGYKVVCTTGEYAVTGKTLNALVGYKIVCTKGSYAVTGKTLEPVYNENMTITPAVFSVILTFNDPTILAGGVVHGGVVHMFMDMSMN